MFDRRHAVPWYALLMVLPACAESTTDPGPAAMPEAQPAATIRRETLTFQAADGLDVTADLRLVLPSSAPFILLFHQAGWSRGEYGEIMPRLNDLGFNCMAIDQRSGGSVKGVENETHRRALAADKGTSYLDAYQDMQAALHVARDRYATGRLIVWGSSYSAALALKLAAENGDLVNAVLAFSPGEYFVGLGQSPTFIASAARRITDPAFITSARGERRNWQPIFDAIPSAQKRSFVPETAGNHGSRALWAEFPDSRDYWEGVTAFLAEFFPRAAKATD